MSTYYDFMVEAKYEGKWYNIDFHTKDIDGKAYGHMLLQLPEGENEAQKVISWLAANNMKYTEEA